MNEITKSNLSFYEGKIITIRDRVGKDFHEVGRLLNLIKDSTLYKLKTPDWDQYVYKTFGIRRRSAENVMKLALNYDNATVAKWGSSKLTLLLEHVPDEEKREEFLTTHEPSTTREEVKSEVTNPSDWTSSRPKKTTPFTNRSMKFLGETYEYIIYANRKVDGIAVNFAREFKNYKYKTEMIEMAKKLATKLEAIE